MSNLPPGHEGYAAEAVPAAASVAVEAPQVAEDPGPTPFDSDDSDVDSDSEDETPPPRRAPAQPAQPEVVEQPVEQPGGAAATPRSPEPPEAPPETDRAPVTPAEPTPEPAAVAEPQARVPVPTDTEPPSDAQGSHEARPTLRPEEAAASDMPRETKPEPVEPATPVEVEPEPTRPKEPLKAADDEAKIQKAEPKAKPVDDSDGRADERPLQERVPLEQPKPDEKATEPKAKAKSSAKPGMLDRLRGMFGRTPPPPTQDPAGAASSDASNPAGAPAQPAQPEVVEQPGRTAATPRSPEPPEAPPETDRAPLTPADLVAKQGRGQPGAVRQDAAPGLDLDSVMARMATGSNHLALSLSRSYMHMQDLVQQVQATQGTLRVEAPALPRAALPLVALPPLPPPAAPPPEPVAPTQEISLQELLKGRMRSLQDQERKELWSKSLHFDLAIVFPNPDFEENRGFSFLGRNIFSLLAGSWNSPDLAKVERGVGEREAQRLYHDVLRDETASTEAAFMKAFDDLRPWIRGKGREEDWPQSKGTSEATVGQAKMQLRCLSHGGSCRRVDLSAAALQGHSPKEMDLEMGHAPGLEVLYQHTLHPSLSSATDLLSLIRNSIVALLASKGLTVELVFSSDFRWIYALISASEAALEDLATKHHFPRALDLESVDPEATEPCDDRYESLAVAFQREQCEEVMELLKVLDPNARPVPQTEIKKKLKLQEAAVREAYCWYLRSRIKGSSATAAKSEANAAWGKERQEWEPWERPQPPLRNTWDRLVRSSASNGPEVVRVGPGSAQARHCQRVQVPRLDGVVVTSRFSREDRILLSMAAVSDVCDVFKLMTDGYVADVLPCKGSVRREQSPEGQASSLQLAFRRQMSTWIMVPALFGIIAQVVVAVLGREQCYNTVLGYALLTSFWFSIALGAWKLNRKQLLLNRGDVPGSDGSFDICCGSGFVRPSDSADPRPFGSTRRQFYGGLKRSLITGEMEEQANPCFKCLRRGLILVLCLVFAFASVALAAATCDLLPLPEEKFTIHQIEYSCAQHIVGLVVVLEIWLLNRFFRFVSLIFTRWENHKTRSEFVHAYHLKALGLQLVNSYASLFYIAFYPDSFKLYEVSHSCSYAETWWNYWGATCRMARLNKQLMTILAAFCLKVAFRCILFKLISSAVNPKTSQSTPERTSGLDVLKDLDRVMMAPRFGDPETDLNVMPSCCFNASSEVIIVLGMFFLFFPASPWIGLLTFIFMQLSTLASHMAPGRRAIPWRAGYPTCHSADLLEASDRLACTAVQAISWLALLCMAALLVWPAELGSGYVTSTLLGQTTSLAAPAAALLLLCRFLPGRLLVRCTPGAARLRTAETRLCRAMQKSRLEGSTSGLSMRSTRGRPRLGTDFRVRTPQQWEELSAKFTS